MSVRNGIIATGVLGLLLLFAVFGLAACNDRSTPPASTVEQEDTCDDPEDLIDTKEDDCGIGSNQKKSPAVKITTKKPTDTKTTSKAVPTKTR